MNNLQKIDVLYHTNQDKPYSNKALISLFEEQFKEALNEQNLKTISTLFSYSYAYKMLENIYQQFFVHPDVMDLILNIKDKKILHQLESLCPSLSREVFSFMIEHDSLKAYQFLTHYHSSATFIDNILNLENIRALTNSESNHLFTHLITNELPKNKNIFYLPQVIEYLMEAQNHEMLNYTINQHQKKLIELVNESNTILYASIKKSYTRFPQAGCIWINFAFSDTQLKPIQDIFEFEFPKSPQNVKYEIFFDKMSECLASNLEKRLLDSHISEIKPKKEKVKI